MNKVTNKWLKIWKGMWLAIFAILAGISTLGFTWVYIDTKGNWGDECWQLTATRALEPWVHYWRGVLLFIAGFLTLGYTWVMMAYLEEPLFMGLRNKYSSKNYGN